MKEGYLPSRILMYIGYSTLASFVVVFLVATLIQGDITSDEWYWLFHGLMGFALSLIVVLSFLIFIRKVTEVKWLERG